MLEQISTDLYQRLQADPQRTEALQAASRFGAPARTTCR